MSTESITTTQVEVLRMEQKIHSDQFAERACESLRKCKASEEDQPLCTVNYDGNHVKFENKCTVLIVQL